MKKVTLALGVLTFSVSSLASDNPLADFCEKTAKNRDLSKIALENDGVYTKKAANRRSNQQEREYYRGCRHDTPWLERAYQIFCDGSNARAAVTQREVQSLRTPKNILFFFDGAADFNASLAYANLRPVNIDGSEGNDLNAGNGNGLGGLTALFGPGYALGKHQRNIELHYHSGSGFHKRENYASALACAEQIKETLDVVSTVGKKQMPVKWIVMGYSNGGALTINFQNDLAKKGVSFELAASIDPIVQTALYVFHGLKDTIGRRNPQTKRFVNFYQNQDYDSFPGLKLRGKPVSEADVNKHIYFASGQYAHVYMPLQPDVISSLNCELGRALENSSRNCSY